MKKQQNNTVALLAIITAGGLISTGATALGKFAWKNKGKALNAATKLLPFGKKED